MEPQELQEGIGWDQATSVNHPGDQDEDRWGIHESPICYAKAHCYPKAEAPQYLVVKSSYTHQVKQGICLLALEQPFTEHRQQSFVEVPKEVCPSLGDAMLQV